MNVLLQRVGHGLCAVALFLGSVDSAQGAVGSEAEQGLKILNSNIVRVVYPYELAMAGTDATVELSYRIDVQGAATGVTVTKTSNPAAAAAFLASLDEMIFETAKLDGRPVLSEIQKLSISIKQMQLAGDLSFIAAIKNPAAVVIGAREVDGGLKPAARLATPMFPTSLKASGPKQGNAVLEFYIDPAGIVRLPKVLSATNPAMGWSAAAAVLTWRFAPPLKDGQPAIVKVTGLPLPVEFAVAPAAAASSSPTSTRVEVYVEAESIVNAQLKMNAEIMGGLPLRVLMEVTEGGALRRNYDLSINNPNVNGVSKITLNEGENAPARIKFLPLGDPVMTGTALTKQ